MNKRRSKYLKKKALGIGIISFLVALIVLTTAIIVIQISNTENIKQEFLLSLFITDVVCSIIFGFIAYGACCSTWQIYEAERKEEELDYREYIKKYISRNSFTEIFIKEDVVKQKYTGKLIEMFLRIMKEQKIHFYAKVETNDTISLKAKNNAGETLYFELDITSSFLKNFDFQRSLPL